MRERKRESMQERVEEGQKDREALHLGPFLNLTTGSCLSSTLALLGSTTPLLIPSCRPLGYGFSCFHSVTVMFLGPAIQKLLRKGSLQSRRVVTLW